jgi:hypothetical protein
MKYLVRALSGLMIIVFAVANSTPASSTPFINVRADWQVSLDRTLSPTIPNGITLSCFGGATGIANGCSDTRSLIANVPFSGNLSLLVVSGLLVTNTSEATIGGLLSFATTFSAFNPGGPNIGIDIDNATTQGASFSSSVLGPGVKDSHSCSIGLAGYSAQGVFSPTTCGVASPDFSIGNFSIDLASIGPGQSEQIPYQIAISADFIIPEPSSIALVMIGLLGIAALGRRSERLRVKRAAQGHFLNR